MLSPDFLLIITEKAEEMAARLNEYLTQRIVKRIMSLLDKEGRVELIPSSVSDIKKMQETGKLAEEIAKDLKGKMPDIEKEIDEAFETARERITEDSDRFTEEVAKKAGIDQKEIPKKKITKKEKALLKQAYEKTNGTMYNLSGSTVNAAQKQYIEAVDDAIWKATHGVSPHTAIAEAIDEVAKSGAYVLYDTGRKDRIETAITRAVRTGINQAAGEITLARCAELGVNQVLVSSHLGARYTDKDEPANHMSWQGKVYDIDWKSAVFEKYHVSEKQENEEDTKAFAKIRKAVITKLRPRDKSAGDFREKTGYGTGEGLCGWNCRHTFDPFVVGINRNNTEDFDSEKNKKQYDIEQKQRAAERKIRNIKRKKNVLKAAEKEALDINLKNELQKKRKSAEKEYDEKMKEYYDYCSKHGLRTKDERLKISNRIDANETKNIVKKMEEDIKNRQKELKNKIKSGEVSLKIKHQQFLKHVKGTKQYEDYERTRGENKGPQSRILITEEEAQKLIQEKNASGNIVNTKTKVVEFVTCDKTIGEYYNTKEKKWMKTKRVEIHYGKDGSHIVPVKEK